MPIFEFTCKDCERVFELLIRTKNQEIICPLCSSKQVSKLFSSFSYSSSGDSRGNSGLSCSTCSGGNCSSCH